MNQKIEKPTEIEITGNIIDVALDIFVNSLVSERNHNKPADPGIGERSPKCHYEKKQKREEKRIKLLIRKALHPVDTGSAPDTNFLEPQDKSATKTRVLRRQDTGDVSGYIIETVGSAVTEPYDIREEELLIEEKKQIPPADEEVMTADDWIGLMEGGSSNDGYSGSGSEQVDEVREVSDNGVEGLGYTLKNAPNYNEKHLVPSRQVPRQKEKPQVKKGMKLKEFFTRAKLSFQQRFGGDRKNTAKLCSACGRGEKATQCIICKREDSGVMARLCKTCSEDKKIAGSCFICGRPNARIVARVCDEHAGNTCVRCGAKL